MAASVFIVDDHYMVVEGIRSLLQHEQNIEWAGHASNAASCLAFLKQQQPDVILMDINLPDKSGIDLCKEVKEGYGNVKQKKNTIGLSGEKSLSQLGGMELRYSSTRRGLATATINLVNIDFNVPENTPLAFEMLEGLKTGVNYTWNLSIQRNISSSFQLSLNYDGRKPNGVKTIHTGGVQVRAYF